MNRFFAITGFLAAGMAFFWVWFVISLPWLWNSRSPDPSSSRWFVWVGISVSGIGIIFAFVRYALTAHWAALRRNTPMPRAAWRGTGVVYLLVTIIFAIPVLAGDPSGSHRNEMFIYTGLTALCLALTAVAFYRGLRNPPPTPPSSRSS